MHSTASINDTWNDDGDDRSNGVRDDNNGAAPEEAPNRDGSHAVAQGWDRHRRPGEHAVWYAETVGWPVVAGHWTTHGRCSCGDERCEQVGAHPLHERWWELATADPSEVAEVWRTAPRASVLAVTGKGVSAIEMPTAIGWGVLEVLERHAPDAGPVIDGRRPSGARFWFFVDGLPPDPAGGTNRIPPDIRAIAELDLIIHAERSWVPLPSDDKTRTRVWSVPPVTYDSSTSELVRRNPTDVSQVWDALREQFG